MSSAGLLEQEGEADGEQHLAQHVGFDRDNRNFAFNTKYSTMVAIAATTSEFGTAADDVRLPLLHRQGEQDRQPEGDDAGADEFEAFRAQEQALHDDARARRW